MVTFTLGLRREQNDPSDIFGDRDDVLGLGEAHATSMQARPDTGVKRKLTHARLRIAVGEDMHRLHVVLPPSSGFRPRP